MEKEKAAIHVRLNSVQKIQEGTHTDINVLRSDTDYFRVLEQEVADSVGRILTFEKTQSNMTGVFKTQA
ncbi:hypothetical protein DPMN_056459 [Dreissena polymorpha]|uniref:Uncharacterized protein n=1 Tax=Dreissena polymorpha TaxID=45954 RepID=A0A9D4CTA5_DREPO|nr:hypothetical protein DPMN_056459 [Dreissena polymorpha]